jgi:hypothetical protein
LKKTMRVSFSSTNVARAAAGVLAAYGYSAEQIGTDVFTDCPALLAVPAIAKRVGLAEVDRIDLSGRRAPSGADQAPFPLAPQRSGDAAAPASSLTFVS